MTHEIINHAFILAAGEGRRLRPYTDHCPKPMVKLAGKPIIDYTIDKLIAAGVTTITVNLHYMADTLAAHLQKRTDVRINLSFEDKLLDTGGGLANALDTMNGRPFYIISGDAFWVDHPHEDTLPALAAQWDTETTDLLLLLQPADNMKLTHGVGDYAFDDNGIPVRILDKTGTHMFTSIRIAHPRLFDGCPEGPFSFLQLMDKAEAEGRLRAVIHKGDWHHISTPEELERVEKALTESRNVA